MIMTRTATKPILRIKPKGSLQADYSPGPAVPVQNCTCSGTTIKKKKRNGGVQQPLLLKLVKSYLMVRNAWSWGRPAFPVALETYGSCGKEAQEMF